MLNIKGIITALVTPFNEDGTVNYDKLNELIQDQVSNNIETIIIGGTTGEGMLIDNISEFYNKTIEIVDNRLTVGVTLFEYKKQELLHLIQNINKLSCDFVLVNTPYYLSTSGSGILEYYSLIDQHLNKPYIIYYNPIRSGQYIMNSTWDKLFKLNNLIGIKDASNDCFTSNYIIKNKKNLLYFTGNDTNYFNNRILGSDGLISSAANLLPEVFTKIEYLINKSDFKQAKELYFKYYDLLKNINVEPNPIGLKYLMNEKGLNVGDPKFPLTKLSFNQQIKLKTIYEGVK